MVVAQRPPPRRCPALRRLPLSERKPRNDRPQALAAAERTGIVTTKPEPIATNVYDKQPGGTYRANMHVSGLAIQRALRHIRPGTRQELARFRLGQHPAPKPHMLPPGGFPLGTQLAFEKATPTVRRLPTDLSCIEPQSHACPSCARSCLAAVGGSRRLSSTS